MKQHKYESLIKFIHLDGIKEFKETDPTLFSKDGISTITIEVDNGKDAPVTIEDVKNACNKYLDKKLSLFQLQQWGEWIHMMDFFELIPNGESPNYDETLINLLTKIDMLDTLEPGEVNNEVVKIISKCNEWLSKNK